MVLIWAVAVIFVGFKILAKYRDKREKGEKNCLGREALLIGTLTAFLAQLIVGLFIINRSLNGTALLVLLFLSALVFAHLLLMKKN
jgi:Na+/citrate or Na+/malate symporter